MAVIACQSQSEEASEDAGRQALTQAKPQGLAADQVSPGTERQTLQGLGASLDLDIVKVEVDPDSQSARP